MDVDEEACVRAVAAAPSQSPSPSPSPLPHAPPPVLIVFPTLLMLVASYVSDYAVPELYINGPVYLLTLVPKLPAMHQVRLFGINRTPGIDDDMMAVKPRKIRLD